MKATFFFVLSILVFGTISQAADRLYTQQELQAFSPKELVDLILHLQSKSQNPNAGLCKSFKPLDGEGSNVFSKVNNPGYTDHGSLKWPNGQIFMRRNSGSTNDFSFYYPDGKIMYKRSLGFANDRSIYWPNDQVLLKKNEGYQDNNSLFHADGSSWLRRNPGYTNDGQLTGLPIDQFEQGEVQVRAMITDKKSVIVQVQVDSDLFKVSVDIDPSLSKPVTVRECVSFPSSGSSAPSSEGLAPSNRSTGVR